MIDRLAAQQQRTRSFVARAIILAALADDEEQDEQPTKRPRRARKAA